MKKTVAILSALILIMSGLSLSACNKQTEPNPGEHGRTPSIPEGVTLYDVPENEYYEVADKFYKKCEYDYSTDSRDYNGNFTVDYSREYNYGEHVNSEWLYRGSDGNYVFVNGEPVVVEIEHTETNNKKIYMNAQVIETDTSAVGNLYCDFSYDGSLTATTSNENYKEEIDSISTTTSTNEMYVDYSNERAFATENYNSDHYDSANSEYNKTDSYNNLINYKTNPRKNGSSQDSSALYDMVHILYNYDSEFYLYMPNPLYPLQSYIPTYFNFLESGYLGYIKEGYEDYLYSADCKIVLKTDEDKTKLYFEIEAFQKYYTEPDEEGHFYEEFFKDEYQIYIDTAANLKENDIENKEVPVTEVSTFVDDFKADKEIILNPAIDGEPDVWDTGIYIEIIYDDKDTFLASYYSFCKEWLTVDYTDDGKIIIPAGLYSEIKQFICKDDFDEAKLTKFKLNISTSQSRYNSQYLYLTFDLI